MPINKILKFIFDTKELLKLTYIYFLLNYIANFSLILIYFLVHIICFLLHVEWDIYLSLFCKYLIIFIDLIVKLILVMWIICICYVKANNKKNLDIAKSIIKKSP